MKKTKKISTTKVIAFVISLMSGILLPLLMATFRFKFEAFIAALCGVGVIYLMNFVVFMRTGIIMRMIPIFATIASACICLVFGYTYTSLAACLAGIMASSGAITEYLARKETVV